MAIIGLIILFGGFIFIAKGFFVKSADGLKQEINNSKENIARFFGAGLVVAGYGLAYNVDYILHNLGWVVLIVSLALIWNLLILFQKIEKYNKEKEAIMAENLKLYADTLTKPKETTNK